MIKVYHARFCGAEGNIRLSWNEIRHRATRFAQEWKDAHYEKGETQTFYNDFFEVFGIQSRKVATFEEPVKRAGSNAPGFIDLFWKGTLFVEQKSAGRDLTKAKEQALDYFPGIKDTELPRYVLVCDFQTFELYDLDTREEVKFSLADLHKNERNLIAPTHLSWQAERSCLVKRMCSPIILTALLRFLRLLFLPLPLLHRQAQVREEFPPLHLAVSQHRAAYGS